MLPTPRSAVRQAARSTFWIARCGPFRGESRLSIRGSKVALRHIDRCRDKGQQAKLSKPIALIEKRLKDSVQPWVTPPEPGSLAVRLQPRPAPIKTRKNWVQIVPSGGSYRGHAPVMVVAITPTHRHHNGARLHPQLLGTSNSNDHPAHHNGTQCAHLLTLSSSFEILRFVDCAFFLINRQIF